MASYEPNNKYDILILLFGKLKRRFLKRREKLLEALDK